MVALVVALALWMLHGAGGDKQADDKASGRAGAGFSNKLTHDRVDARTLERASIAGTIRDETGKPIAGARVCADASTPDLPHELVRDPRCTVADASGVYLIANVYAAEYTVAAMAPHYLPASFIPGSEPDISSFALRAGEHRTGVDIVLLSGGVEVTGVVSDVSGGPIARASVRAVTGTGMSHSHPWPAIDTDDSGTFSLWVKPGDVMVSAAADGYADGSDFGRAPGKVNVLLTPESSLAGTVVDANTNEPVAGVTVEAAGQENGGSDITDDDGHFHVSRITPGRYTLVARSPHAYGHSDGSTRVGLAQHVTGVVVKLYPAFQISGRVVEPGDRRATCKRSWLNLRQAEPSRSLQGTRNADGSLHVDGVLRGTYEVTAGCDGFIRREKYPPIAITDKDVANLEWAVDAGAELRGHVLTKSGAPVEGAMLFVRSSGGGGSGTSRKDGSYHIDGLNRGNYLVSVQSEQGVSPMAGWKVDVQTTTVDKDLVLDDGGTIKGIVVDADGKPVAGANITAQSDPEGDSASSGLLPPRSSEDGGFVINGLRPGRVRVVASRGWTEEMRKPGSNDDAKQGEQVTVAAGQTASVRLVVESQSAAIKGTCVDADGKPITDAFVSAARESDAAGSQHSSVTETRWTWDDKPTLTTTDGRFELGELSPGAYTVRAERKGGAEAIAEHVAAGTSIKLVFRPTGQIDGIVHGAGSTPDEIELVLRDDKTGLSRKEEFFRTGGSFTMADLPAGHFTITVSAGGGRKQVAVDLADGEHKKGVDIQLDALVTLTGRVVELGTTTPIPGMQMVVAMGASGGTLNLSSIGHDSISDAAGRFTLKNAPIGTVEISGFPRDPTSSDYDFVSTVRQVAGSGTIDIGDISVVKNRLKPGETEGEMGVNWVHQPYDTPPEQRRFEVSSIDPNGPAAATELKVGDVVTTVDGVDVSGVNHRRGYTLMGAPPGTKLVLGLARGVAVTVVLSAPH